jgi:hypothetical protein
LYKEKLHHIPSPIKFDKQPERNPIDLQQAEVSEERFSYIPPAKDFKFRRALASNFQKSKGQNLDEYLFENVTETIKENAFN